MRARLLATTVGVLLGLAVLPVLSTSATAGQTSAGGRFCTVGPYGNPVDGCAPVLPDSPPMPPRNPDFGIAFGVPAGTPPNQVDGLDSNMRQGIALLGAASVAPDPGQAAQDRAQAQAAFMSAANAIAGVPLQQPMVGFIDPVNGSFVVSPDQWRVDVGNDLTNGLILLRQNQPDQAMADFEAADTLLIQNR